jgi:CBASS immunity sensor of nucleotide second messenger signals
LAGLVAIAPGVDHSPYDDLGKRLIESGRTEHTPESLRALVEKQGLVAEKDAPFKSTFAVRSFPLYAHPVETDGACVVDLTDLFAGRIARAEESWSGEIPQRLRGALPQVEKLPEPIYVALDAHLSIAWRVGRLLDPKFGKRVVLRQRVRGKGTEVWDVSAPARPDGAPSWTVTPSETGTGGTDIAVVVSVTHSALADAARFVTSLPSVGRVVHAELGPGSQVVRDGGHARWLADELVRSLGAIVAERRPAHLHVFLACPASLAFLLGQESQVLGPHAVYEFDFSDPGRGYRPGITSGTE